MATKLKGRWFGSIQKGQRIKGSKSKAVAKVTDVRLVSDLSAECIGCFFIPKPHNKNNPKYEAGTKTFTLINDADNDVNFASTVSEEAYRSQGTIEKVQEEIISVKNAKIQQKQHFKAEYIEKPRASRSEEPNIEYLKAFIIYRIGLANEIVCQNGGNS